jgi:hypothetical protein
MQPKTGNTLIIYGHGATWDSTFDFRRPANSVAFLYSWTREGILIWDSQMKLVANDLLQNGNIRDSYSNQNKSTIGGTLIKNLLLEPPTGLQLPTIPPAYAVTVIPALMGRVWHNAASLANSTRMVFMMDVVVGAAVQPQLFFDDIVMNDPNFSNRPLDVLWCACKGNV